MDSRRTTTLIAVACLHLPPVCADAQQRTNQDQSSYSEMHEEGFAPKTARAPVPAAQAGLRDGDLVLGVVVGDEARAYAVNSLWLPQNEVLNDTLGGAAIAATW